MEIINYEEYEKYFMKKTHPENTDSIGILMKQASKKEIPTIKERLKGINEKFIEYCIFFFTDNHKTSKVIKFQKLEDFGEAIEIHKQLINKNSPSYAIPIWIGGYTLGVCIKVNEETKSLLRKLQKQSKIPEDYTGMKL